MRAILLGAMVAFGCGKTSAPDGGTEPDAPIVEPCAGEDPDGDAIANHDEGSGDPDGDGQPSSRDDDSDGDGIRDADEAGDLSCDTPPADLDEDGTPDFLDRDANGDGIDDAEQAGDGDGDGIPDHRDMDVDGDAIPNDVEWGEGEAPADTDGDGTPDLRDVDSDGDTIADAHEGRVDVDGDGVPAFRDLDSDDDGLSDAQEAGDADLQTPPAECPNERDPVLGELLNDGRPDFADTDSDNDGVGDREEVALGTSLCDDDSDDDGVGDLVESTYERASCPDGTTGVDCGCASNTSCTLPDDVFYVVLPYAEPPVERDLELLAVGTVPLELDTGLRDDATDPAPGVDATWFIKRRQPACRATPPTEPCWQAPEGVPHEDAVERIDDSTFFGVTPGTRVTFRITFKNDFEIPRSTTKAFIASIDLRTGIDILETRRVIIVVPPDFALQP